MTNVNDFFDDEQVEKSNLSMMISTYSDLTMIFVVKHRHYEMHVKLAFVVRPFDFDLDEVEMCHRDSTMKLMQVDFHLSTYQQ